MRICVWHSDKQREIDLAIAIAKGIKLHGDEAITKKLAARAEIPDVDAAMMVGVKSSSLWKRHKRAGVMPIMLDKGYDRSRGQTRVWKYWRVAVDAHNATDFIGHSNFDGDRFKQLKVPGMRPWRTDGGGGHIVLAGSSMKYHEFHGLRHPTVYAQKVIKKIRKLTERRIVYRPKPSWRGAVHIEGTTFSPNTQHVGEALEGAHCLVTHGSNACFEAVLLGVPCIILGQGVAKSISSTTLKDIRAPLLAREKLRRRWLHNLAYAQWTLAEFSTGQAWPHIRPQIERRLTETGAQTNII